MGIKKEFQRGIIRASALILANRQLKEIYQTDSHQCRIDCPKGYMRGIDFYDASELPKIIAAAFSSFFFAHGYFPNLMYPLRFNEKVVWSKFFRPFKVPESGNKLLTSTFIGDDLKHQIKCPEIVWHSSSPLLPGNEQIEPGNYFLKSNHGSGNFQKITYPLHEENKIQLESLCNRWLDKPFGLKTGEWWYNTFTREIFLEREISSHNESLSWQFYTFGDEIPFIAVVKKLPGPKQTSWFDGNMKLLPFQPPGKKQIADSLINQLTPSSISRMKTIARGIAHSHQFSRVDLLIDDDQAFYLNELTFTPSDGKKKLPSEFDLQLGNLWKL